MIATKSVMQPYFLNKSVYTGTFKSLLKQNTSISRTPIKQYTSVWNPSIRQYTKVATPYVNASERARVNMTLFSKDNCQLCDKALYVLDEIYLKKPEYKEMVGLEIIDINNPLNKEWWDKYCFDVPVLHISEVNTNKGINDSAIEDTEVGDTGANNVTKIFHKLDENDVITKINRLI